jgi:hypothetical protein
MVKLVNKLIIYIFVGLAFSPFVLADDSLFDDDVLFDGSDKEFDGWSDDADLFVSDEINSTRPLPLATYTGLRKNGDIIL